jgi:hypothetical protein
MVMLAYVHSLFLSAYADYDDADTRFDFKAKNQQLNVKVYDKNTVLLDTVLDINSAANISGKGYQLQRQDMGYNLTYRGTDRSILSLFIDFDGHVKLGKNAASNFLKKKSWGIRTEGKLVNEYNHLFYQMYSNANEFHNYGLFKTYSGTLSQNYLFNRGILDFGDATNILSPAAYDIYAGAIKKDAKPQFKNKTIDDYGVLISQGKLKISGLNYRACGYTDIDELILEKGASVSVQQNMTVQQDIQGDAGRIENQGTFLVGYTHSQNLRLQEWDNHGIAYFSQPSELITEEYFNNPGLILSSSDFLFESKKRIGKIGTVASEGAVKAAVLSAQDSEGIECLKDACLASKKEKIRLLMKLIQHTDYYTNFITNHYEYNEYGHEYKSKTTETGYQLQKRTTEVTEKLIEHDVPLPDQVQNLILDMMKRKSALSSFKDQLKKNLKHIGKINGDHQSIMNVLSVALAGVGLDDDEVAEILGDGDIQEALAKLISYDHMDDQMRQQATAGNSTSSSYLKNMAQRAMDSGYNLMKWINRNPGEFIDSFCTAVLMTGKNAKSKGVQAIKIACGLGKFINRKNKAPETGTTAQPHQAPLQSSGYSKKQNLSATQRKQLQNIPVTMYGKNPGNVKINSQITRVDTEILGGAPSAVKAFEKITGSRLDTSVKRYSVTTKDGKEVQFRTESKSNFTKIDIKHTLDDGRIIIEKITFRE